MNALFRLGVGTFLVLLVMDAANAQQALNKKLLDSAGRLKDRASKEFSERLQQTARTSKLGNILGAANDSSQRKQVFDLSNVSVGSGMQRVGNSYRAIYELGGQLSVFRIPVDLQLSNSLGQSLFRNPLEGNLFKMGFDRQSLLKSMVPELDNYEALRDEVFGGKGVSTVLREQLMERVKKEGASQQSKWSGIYDYINQYGGVEELLKMDEVELKQKLYAMVAKKKDSLIMHGKDSVAVYAEKGRSVGRALLDSIAGEVLAMKHQLSANGISPERISAIEQRLKEPKGTDLNGYISKYGLNGLKRNGWEGLLQRLANVELGSFGQQLPGSFMNKDVFLQGGAFSIKTAKGAIEFGLAASRDIGFAKDAGFDRSNFNIPKWVTFLSVPVLGHGYTRSRVSWTGSLERQSYRMNESAGISPRSGSALTLSQELGSEKVGRFTLELSKSAMAFRNVGQIGSEHVLLERNSFGNYFRDDLLETMAFGAKYDFSEQRSKFSTNLFFNYSGVGFQNPGQQGFANMGLRMGGSLKKGFLKNRIVLNFRGDLKNTPVSGNRDAHWQNHNLNIEARFRLGRKINLAMKYMDNGVQQSGAQQQSIYASKKYQLDASGSYRLFKKSGFSHLVMGVQQMNNPLALSQNQFLTSIYTQSLSLGTVTLMGNLFYNKELGRQKLLGDMLNADAAVQYQFSQKITASTGATYLDNAGQVRQMGIKQNLQFTAWKNFEVNLYADVRKNIVAPLYPELFASNRADVSLKYYFR